MALSIGKSSIVGLKCQKLAINQILRNKQEIMFRCPFT